MCVIQVKPDTHVQVLSDGSGFLCTCECVYKLNPDMHLQVTNDGSKFLFRTNLNAPRNKLISIDVQSPDQVTIFG